MNILMMTNTYTPIVGGLERSIQSFTEELRKRGHKVRVVAPEYDGMPENEFGVVRLPAIRQFARTPFSVKLPMPGQLSRLFESFEPDLVHAHHPFLIGDMGRRLSGQFEIPFVLTYHTMFSHYTHMFPVRHPAAEAFVESLATGFAGLADLVVVPSESIRRFLKRHGVRTPCSVVPTGIDVRRFARGDASAGRRRHGIPLDALVVGHLGRLSKEKNLGLLRDVITELLRRRPEAFALVVGDGPERHPCAEAWRRAGVGDRCRLPGVLDGDELVDAYHAMDVFAFASKSETQGIVVAEAMAAGLPVVALNAPGVREVVADEENGRLLRREDVASFVAALESIVDRPEAEAQRLRRGALATARGLTPERCTDRLEKAYGRASRGFARQDIHGPLSQLIRRLETEWDLLRNLGHASSEALDFDR